MKVGAPDTTATAGAPKSRKNSNQIIPRQSPVSSLKARMNRVNVPLSFLRRGNVLAANAMGLIFTSSAGGLIFLLTVYLQQILNFSALAAGVAFLPPALIFFFVGGWGSSWLTNRIGMKPVLILSMGLVTVGSALLIPITVASGYFGILPGLVVWSLGASIGFVALSIAAVAGTQHGEEGLASGLINTSERIGFPLGLAVLLTIATTADPAPVGAASPSLASLVGGFQYAFLAALIALRIRNQKPPPGWSSTPQ